MKWMEERGGLKKVTVRFLPLRRRPPGAKESKIQGIQLRDAEVLEKKGTYFKEVTPVIDRYFLAKVGGYARYLRIIGTNENYLTSESYKVSKGIFFSGDDYFNYSKVAVIGSRIDDEFFNGNGLGKEIALAGERYRVIGVLEEEVMLSRNRKNNWMDWKNDIAIIPVTTMIKRIVGSDILNEISFKVHEVDQLEEGMAEAKEILLANRYNNEDFRIQSRSERMEEWRKMREMWNFVLGAIASISLIVGGIGIMNTLLANITERIREIGIRKAIGAKKRDILFQFLMESIVLSTIGGFLGIFVGIYFANIIQNFAEMDTSISAKIVIISFSFSVLVGIVFGIMPSVKAAKLDPIECLRYE